MIENARTGGHIPSVADPNKRTVRDPRRTIDAPDDWEMIAMADMGNKYCNEGDGELYDNE